MKGSYLIFITETAKRDCQKRDVLADIDDVNESPPRTDLGLRK